MHELSVIGQLDKCVMRIAAEELLYSICGRTIFWNIWTFLNVHVGDFYQNSDSLFD